jgi:hypothetical protein
VRTLLELGVDVGRLASVADELVLGEGSVVAAESAGRTSDEEAASQLSARGLHLSPEGLLAEATRLAAERSRLARGLRTYGRHLQGCDPDHGCTCGLGPLLKLTDKQ